MNFQNTEATKLTFRQTMVKSLPTLIYVTIYCVRQYKVYDSMQTWSILKVFYWLGSTC